MKTFNFLTLRCLQMSLNLLWKVWSSYTTCTNGQLKIHIVHFCMVILQPFHHFTYVTTHSPTLLSLYLHHSSFSNPSVASPMSQFILQPFFCFSFVTSSSLHSPGKLPMTYLGLTCCLLDSGGQCMRLLEEEPLGIRRRMWCQHDKPSPQFAGLVHAALTNTFGNRWIGRGGPVNWSARSLDLTPLDFILRDYMKNQAYGILPLLTRRWNLFKEFMRRPQ